jgi:hypothetical protein
LSLTLAAGSGRPVEPAASDDDMEAAPVVALN